MFCQSKICQGFGVVPLRCGGKAKPLMYQSKFHTSQSKFQFSPMFISFCDRKKQVANTNSGYELPLLEGWVPL